MNDDGTWLRGALRRWSPALALALCWFAVPGKAEAFCIYNKTPWLRFAVNQTEGMQTVGDFSRGVSKWLGPGENVCCNWQERTCNTSGRRDGKVAFHLGFTARELDGQSLCRRNVVAIPAGGWIDVVIDGRGKIACNGYGP